MLFTGETMRGFVICIVILLLVGSIDNLFRLLNSNEPKTIKINLIVLLINMGLILWGILVL